MYPKTYTINPDSKLDSRLGFVYKEEENKYYYTKKEKFIGRLFGVLLAGTMIYLTIKIFQIHGN